MPEKPLVSIGLPTYNRVATLQRAVESALRQDYENIELIISDNGSTDKTQATCLAASQRDGRVKYTRQQSNQGALANFLVVLREARGEFFMWLADDDWLDRSYISKCVELLLASPTHSLVCGKARYYDHGKVAYEEPGINLLDDAGAKRVRAYYEQVERNGTFHGVMRRAQLAGICFPDTLGGDWILIATIAFLGKVETLENVSLCRSAGGESMEVKRYARSYGLRGFTARYPHLNIAGSVFETIVWKGPVYKSLSLPARVLLASRAFAIICRRFLLVRWYARTLERISESHPRFKRAAKLVKRKLTTSSQSR
jgi:glycosyltransferase involved in cell wall biosynthesis